MSDTLKIRLDAPTALFGGQQQVDLEKGGVASLLTLEDVTSEFGKVTPTVTEDGPTVFKAATLLVPVYLPFWDYEFMAEDMRAMAASFNPADPPPILVNHCWDATKIFGHVRAMRYDEQGQRLRVLLEFIGKFACDRVGDKRWRKLSGGFIVTRGERDKSRVEEASVTPFPMVGDAEIDEEEVTMSQPVTPPASGEDKTTSVAAQTKTDTTATPATVTAVDITQDPEYLRVKAQADVLSERVAAIEAERAAEKLEARRQRDRQDLLALVREGYSLPQDELQQLEAKVLAGLSDEQKGDYLALRRKLPQQWPAGGRQSVPEATAPGSSEDRVGAELLKIGAQIQKKAEV